MLFRQGWPQNGSIRGAQQWKGGRGPVHRGGQEILLKMSDEGEEVK